MFWFQNDEELDTTQDVWLYRMILFFLSTIMFVPNDVHTFRHSLFKWLEEIVQSAAYSLSMTFFSQPRIRAGSWVKHRANSCCKWEYFSCRTPLILG